MLQRMLMFLIAVTSLSLGTVVAEIVPDFLMDTDPDCRPMPSTEVSPMPDHIRLWIEVLQRPEIDYQRMAAESIALAHKKGVSGLGQAVPALEAIVSAESSHPAARFAAARALIVIDSRSSASKLLESSQMWGSDLRQLVEPALAEWDFQPIRPIWKERLEAVGQQPRRELLLAIRGIQRIRDSSVLPTLRQIVQDFVQPHDYRLAAAAAAGELAESGLEEDAESLISEKRGVSVINRRCAVRLLQRHASEPARRSLIELAGDDEPSLAAAALERLNEIDSNLVLPLAGAAMKNADANVRLQGAVAFLKLPTAERIEPLSELLADLHPQIRKHVCAGLLRLAQEPEFREAVKSSAMSVAARDRWQGQEQAALLLGSLEHQPAAKRLVELLESPRQEVMVSSAWALRKIADRETIPAIVDKIRRQTVARKTSTVPGLDLQVAHLLEACGKMGAKEAQADLVGYIPKEISLGERSRGAAIWSLGRLNEGVPDETIAGLLIDRVNDEGIMPPELILIKQMSIISLARMKAQAYAAEFRRLLEKGNSNDGISLARRWAVKELTGEEFPLPEADPIGPGTWFLNPIVRTKAGSP